MRLMCKLMYKSLNIRYFLPHTVGLMSGGVTFFYCVSITILSSPMSCSRFSSLSVDGRLWTYLFPFPGGESEVVKGQIRKV